MLRPMGGYRSAVDYSTVGQRQEEVVESGIQVQGCSGWGAFRIARGNEQRLSSEGLSLGSIHVFNDTLGPRSRWLTSVSAAAYLRLLSDHADPPEGIHGTRRGRCIIGGSSSPRRSAVGPPSTPSAPALSSGGSGAGGMAGGDAGTSSDSSDGGEVVEEGGRIGF
eukprot:g3306.t1